MSQNIFSISTFISFAIFVFWHILRYCIYTILNKIYTSTCTPLVFNSIVWSDRYL